MSRIILSIDMPEMLEEQARAAGLLSEERVIALIAAELARQTSWNRLFGTMKQLQSASESDFGHMSETEFIDMVNDIVHEIRAKNATPQSE